MINIYDTKLDHNLTTKRGDSGSAPFLEIKCVMIEAPNLTTKSDQKTTQTRKSDKNQQKITKHKNRKKWKTQKVTKCIKLKSSKMSKTENAKHQK